MNNSELPTVREVTDLLLDQMLASDGRMKVQQMLLSDNPDGTKDLYVEMSAIVQRPVAMLDIKIQI